VPNLRIRDAGREYTFQIGGDAATLGRGDTNDIDIEDAKASKEHCRIERVGQRWKLVDLESKNGTKVNGAFKNKAWLGHGDIVQIGLAEMKFGLEGAARAPAAAATGTAAGQRPRGGRDAEEGDEEDLPRRRYQKKNNVLLLVGLSSAALLGIILLSSVAGGGSNNTLVFKEGERLARDGDWAGAIQYMEQYGEPDEDDYLLIERRLKELREGLAAHDRIRRENEANRIESKVNLLIMSYNMGHVMESGPDKILPLIKQLKEKYAGTESAERVRQNNPAWWAGRVPKPASEYLENSGLGREWGEAVERSQGFRKEWLFREAREAIERFVTDREALLGAGDLAKYEIARDEELRKIDALAESIYRGREQEAERLLKVKRYDDAIAAYQKVVEKFGIDAWVRKAQAEIAKIQKIKAGG
jgi:hypothetical protein